MPWQVGVLILLGLIGIGLGHTSRRALKRAADARDFGSRAAELHNRRMARVTATGLTVVIGVALLVTATALFG